MRQVCRGLAPSRVEQSRVACRAAGGCFFHDFRTNFAVRSINRITDDIHGVLLSAARGRRVVALFTALKRAATRRLFNTNPFALLLSAASVLHRKEFSLSSRDLVQFAFAPQTPYASPRFRGSILGPSSNRRNMIGEFTRSVVRDEKFLRYT